MTRRALFSSILPSSLFPKHANKVKLQPIDMTTINVLVAAHNIWAKAVNAYIVVLDSHKTGIVEWNRVMDETVKVENAWKNLR